MVGLDESEVLVLSRAYGTVSLQLDLIQKKASRPLLSAFLFFLLILSLQSRHFPLPSPFECFFPIAQWTLSAAVVLLARC